MRQPLATIGNRLVGDGERVLVIAEIGINHNGSLEIAKKLIDGAVHAGKVRAEGPMGCGA
jgi:sialic acid synthase SpsE